MNFRVAKTPIEEGDEMINLDEMHEVKNEILELDNYSKEKNENLKTTSNDTSTIHPFQQWIDSNLNSIGLSTTVWPMPFKRPEASAP